MITDSDNFLAKSTGETLIRHSKLVGKFARSMAETAYFMDNPEFFDEIECSGLLHDLAKVLAENQTALKNNTKLIHDPFRHNETVWAFLSKHLQCPNENAKNRILYSVYWHHGINNVHNKESDNIIYDKISENDIAVMIHFARILIKDIPGYTISDSILSETSINSPRYFSNPGSGIIGRNSKTNEENSFTRMCLISADRLLSSKTFPFESFYNESTGEINTGLIKKYLFPFDKIENVEQLKNIHYDNDRFLIQKSIIDEPSKTIQFNAPAGFGKTITGLLWAISNGKKIIWVCPRNTISQSVYESIIQTFEDFNIKDISVELYLTNKVKESTHDSFGFSSDIIVTNIDSYLSPAVSNKNAKRFFISTSANVIFDEYHEYVTSNEQALFGCFINAMKTRHRFTKGKTLLLSATPIAGLNSIWDNDKLEKTKCLPNDHQHYKAAHHGLYKLNITDEPFTVKENSTSLVFYNSKNKTQEFCATNDNCGIYHGKYEDAAKAKMLHEKLIYYGKYSERSITKENLVSTHALQASADISFAHMYESLVSPMATIQRIGRVNRWGDYHDISTINICYSNHKSESAIKKMMYNVDLGKLWFNFLKNYDQKELSLDQFYEIYNEFNFQNLEVIKKYVEHCLSVSNKLYNDNIYPKQISVEEEIVQEEEGNLINKGNKAGTNVIRNTGNEYWSIYPKVGGGYSNVFTSTSYGNSSGIKNMNTEHLQMIVDAMIIIDREKDSRFDYSKLLALKKRNKLKLKHIEDAAKYDKTPFICMDAIYDEKLGLVDEKNYDYIDE